MDDGKRYLSTGRVGEIRRLVAASTNELTADAVRRVVAERDELRRAITRAANAIRDIDDSLSHCVDGYARADIGMRLYDTRRQLTDALSTPERGQGDG